MDKLSYIHKTQDYREIKRSRLLLYVTVREMIFHQFAEQNKPREYHLCLHRKLKNRKN